jgi:hypothetical protein
LHFLNPAMLIGLMAAVIPLAIHLLYRSQTRPIPFSNLDFLRQLHHSRMRRVRLRQWLVLLLRTLIIALLVLAFSRPAQQTGESGWWGRAAPTAAAVLIDQSYSTTYRRPEGRLFDQLQQQAGSLANLFDGRDEVSVIPFARRAQVLERPVDSDHLKTQLKELLPKEESTDIAQALEAAAQYLAQAQLPRREVYLFTDLARSNWEAVELESWPEDTTVYLCSADTSARANVHVEAVRIASWMATAGARLELQVVLNNSAAYPVEGVGVDLYLDGERVRHQTVDLRAGDQRRLEFVVTPRQPGRASGYIEIEDDHLPLDNRRYFALQLPERIRLAVLGHRPSDTYYVRRALSAVAAADPALELRSGFIDELATPLTDVDVLVLCNVQRLDPQQTRQVQDFVAAGGGLILFPAAQADLPYYNRDLLPGLVEARLKGVFQPPQQDSFGTLDQTRPHHPLFADLLPEKAEDRPRFFSAFELAPVEGLQPLIYFTDGRIALASGWRGQGRAVLFAVPLDLEWNNLPLKGAFLPLLHRLVRYLALPPDHRTEYLVGQTVRHYLPDVPVRSHVQAESPSGQRFHLEAELVGGRHFWKIPQVEESGLWRLWHEDKLVDLFPVNVDTQESDLALVERERLLLLFGAEGTHFVMPGDDLRQQVMSNRYGRELWREFILLALVLLMLELWVARAPGERKVASVHSP